MKILVFSWLYEYTLNDILFTLDKMSISYELIKFDVSNIDKSNSDELNAFVDRAIQKSHYDALFSINYFPDIARACYKNSLLYLSWSYDCPLDIKNPEETLHLSTNRAFFFDNNQYLEYENECNTVFHLPLAVNTSRLSSIKYNPKYLSEISFVGNVYSSSYPTLIKYLDNYFIGYLEAIKESQKNLYGCYLSKDSFSDDFIKDLNTCLKKHNCPFVKQNAVSANQIAVSIATEATFENRLLCLGLLSNHFDLKWYAPTTAQVIKNVIKLPPVNYETEMPEVFHSSKINLHIGLHSIASGISLRQLDIMACGGFLLSSYQPELFEYFIPGEDFDYFSSPEESLDKCRFYLANDTLRKNISASGRNKTNNLFSYEKQLNELFRLAFE